MYIIRPRLSCALIHTPRIYTECSIKVWIIFFTHTKCKNSVRYTCIRYTEIEPYTTSVSGRRSAEMTECEYSTARIRRGEFMLQFTVLDSLIFAIFYRYKFIYGVCVCTNLSDIRFHIFFFITQYICNTYNENFSRNLFV